MKNKEEYGHPVTVARNHYSCLLDEWCQELGFHHQPFLCFLCINLPRIAFLMMRLLRLSGDFFSKTWHIFFSNILEMEPCGVGRFIDIKQNIIFTNVVLLQLIKFRAYACSSLYNWSIFFFIKPGRNCFENKMPECLECKPAGAKCQSLGWKCYSADILEAMNESYKQQEKHRDRLVPVVWEGKLWGMVLLWQGPWLARPQAHILKVTGRCAVF